MHMPGFGRGSHLSWEIPACKKLQVGTVPLSRKQYSTRGSRPSCMPLKIGNCTVFAGCRPLSSPLGSLTNQAASACFVIPKLILATSNVLPPQSQAASCSSTVSTTFLSQLSQKIPTPREKDFFSAANSVHLNCSECHCWHQLVWLEPFVFTNVLEKLC